MPGGMMSHYMTALAMKQQGLKPAAKIVLYWLADHHNSETGACFPSLQTLARECEMDKATVTRHLADLEAAGLIERRKRTRDNGSQTSTEYLLRLETPVANRDSPCCKTQQPPVANYAPPNLGSKNLGSEPEHIRADDGFERFWMVYGHKVAKGAARKAFKAALRKADAETITEGARRFAAVRNPQYVPHAATWLNAERWGDDFSALQSKPMETKNERKPRHSNRDVYAAFDEIDRRLGRGVEGGGPSGPDEQRGAGEGGDGVVLPLLAARHGR